MNTKKLDELSPNDRAEVLKFQRFLNMRRTKRGRHYLATQKFWREYQGVQS